MEIKSNTSHLYSVISFSVTRIYIRIWITIIRLYKHFIRLSTSAVFLSGIIRAYNFKQVSLSCDMGDTIELGKII